MRRRDFFKLTGAAVVGGLVLHLPTGATVRLPIDGPPLLRKLTMVQRDERVIGASWESWSARADGKIDSLIMHPFATRLRGDDHA